MFALIGYGFRASEIVQRVLFFSMSRLPAASDAQHRLWRRSAFPRQPESLAGGRRRCGLPRGATVL